MCVKQESNSKQTTSKIIMKSPIRFYDSMQPWYRKQDARHRLEKKKKQTLMDNRYFMPSWQEGMQ